MTHADFSKWEKIDNIPEGTFPQELLSQLIEVPDHVFIGWGYVDGVLIKPLAPEGFLYDDGTGTFYPVGSSLLGQIQHTTFGVTHDAVDKGIITEETFKEITGEDFIHHTVIENV